MFIFPVFYIKINFIVKIDFNDNKRSTKLILNLTFFNLLFNHKKLAMPIARHSLGNIKLNKTKNNYD